ncbi:MAG: ABC transporter ATP-binding protein [Desulfurococcales archaeon]|nr:ABC transporter ATP-binding protein [Desulfurococcales archaeon]
MRQLETLDLRKSFGGIRALDGVSIAVDKGSVVSIVGPNGAGKTTLFKCIAGYYKPDGGKILLKGEEVQGKRPPELVRRGVSVTFQVPRPFRGLSVLENILAAIGSPSYSGARFLRRVSMDDYERARIIAETMGLERFLEMDASLLPLGLQKRLEIAKALAMEPELIMLDEPTAGMSREEARDVARIIEKLRDEGITVMLIEHNVPFAVSVSDYMYVLNYGKVLSSGIPREVIRDQRVVEAYLGRGYTVS